MQYFLINYFITTKSKRFHFIIRYELKRFSRKTESWIVIRTIWFLYMLTKLQNLNITSIIKTHVSEIDFAYFVSHQNLDPPKQYPKIYLKTLKPALENHL